MPKIRNRVRVIPMMSQVIHMELDWDLPNNVFDEDFDQGKFEKDLKELGILRLYDQSKIGPGHAAKLLGLTREEFITILGKRGFNYVNLTPAELDEEVEIGRQIAELRRKTKK